MKPNKRNLLSMLFIIATLVLVIAIAFSNGELTNAWSALFTLDIRWVLGALAGWAAYLMFDALGLFYFLRQQKHPVSLRYATYVSLIGFYYGNITPGASGGQPLQVYYMNKREIPVAIGTSALSIKFFANQVMIVLIATVLWLTNLDFVNSQLAGVKWAIYIGYIINFVSIPLILLVAFHRPLVQAVIAFFVKLGAKMRLCKHPDELLLRISGGLDTYHASILRIVKHPRRIFGQLALSGLSVLGLMAVPLTVYYAFGMSGTPWYQLLTVSFLLFLSASYTPLPGASGAQEGGFLAFYRGLFTSGTIGLALLVWRFFTYYLFLIVGATVSIVTSLRDNKSKRKSAAVPPEAAQPASESDASGKSST